MLKVSYRSHLSPHSPSISPSLPHYASPSKSCNLCLGGTGKLIKCLKMTISLSPTYNSCTPLFVKTSETVHWFPYCLILWSFLGMLLVVNRTDKMEVWMGWHKGCWKVSGSAGVRVCWIGCFVELSVSTNMIVHPCVCFNKQTLSVVKAVH